MPKKKRKKFDVVSAVKAAAREKVGPVPATRKEAGTPKSRKRREKHKSTLSKLLEDD